MLILLAAVAVTMTTLAQTHRDGNLPLIFQQCFEVLYTGVVSAIKLMPYLN